MIRVYNKQSNYLRVLGKVIAPFKTEEFEERNQQIRILERNGIVSVTEDLSNNTIPTTSNVVVDNGEELKAKTETETDNKEDTPNKIVEDTVIVNKEDIIPEDEVKKLKEDEIQDVKAKNVIMKKITKRKTKKGGNK